MGFFFCYSYNWLRNIFVFKLSVHCPRPTYPWETEIHEKKWWVREWNYTMRWITWTFLRMQKRNWGGELRKTGNKNEVSNRRLDLGKQFFKQYGRRIGCFSLHYNYTSHQQEKKKRKTTLLSEVFRPQKTLRFAQSGLWTSALVSKFIW